MFKKIVVIERGFFWVEMHIKMVDYFYINMDSRKKSIYEKYLKTKMVSDKDWAFCEKIDWHPADELPLKEEFVKELQMARKEKPIKVNSVDEIFKQAILIHPFRYV